MCWNLSLFRGALISILNFHPSQRIWNLCKVYHTYKCLPSENASHLMVMPVGFLPVKNNSHLTVLYHCKIHLLAMGSSLWTANMIRAAMTAQIHWIPGQWQGKGWEQPYKLTCFFAPRCFSSRQVWHTDRAGIMLRSLLILPDLNSILSGCEASQQFQWVQYSY